MTIARDSITFRPETDADADFLHALYATTRAAEMAVVPWTPEQKEEFVRMQFYAQTVHYKKHFADASFLIIEKEGVPIGRLYRRSEDGDLRVIDISLMPEHRGGGIGTVLMRELMDEAASRGETLSIHVEYFNPALRLYQRLGFRHISTYGVYYLMEWRAGGA